MSHVKAIRIKTDKSKFTLLYNGKPFITILRSMVPEFYADLAKDMKFQLLKKEKVKTKRKVIQGKTVVEDDRRTRALQLAKFYAKMHKQWSHAKVAIPIGENHKDFKHLLSAIDIINRQGVKYKTFLKAQIEGLKFANDGKGIFPKINQLSTTNAEFRLVEYLKSGKAEKIRIELTEFEKATPLQENKLYVERYDKFKIGQATYREALYIKNCIIARRGSVPKRTLREIEALKKKR